MLPHADGQLRQLAAISRLSVACVEGPLAQSITLASIVAVPVAAGNRLPSGSLTAGTTYRRPPRLPQQQQPLPFADFLTLFFFVAAGDPATAVTTGSATATVLTAGTGGTAWPTASCVNG